jgi:hypothetical protein
VFYSEEDYNDFHNPAPMATDTDAMREHARNVGYYALNIDHQWLLDSRDVWVRNPHYTGPEQRHPEDYPDDWS